MTNNTSPSGLPADLRRYLQESRDAALRGLDGLSDYDSRRPLTPSGTNILGLIKHLAGVENSYLVECVGRPSPVQLPWVDDGSIWDGADMWVTADQSRAYIVDLYREVWTHADASIAELPLSHPAEVSWWPPERRETTLGHLVVRVIAETAQHAGHIDVLREGLTGQGGRDHDSFGDAQHWATYVANIQVAADRYKS